MQTNFTLAQLADPNLAEANQILRACVHCGFCTATCPTYVVLGDELDGPRGRIYLMKNMLERAAPADEITVKHIDRCLSCLSCMTTCPSSVDYMHLLDHARAHIEKTHRRPVGDIFLRSLLSLLLPNPRRFRLALHLARVVAPFQKFLPRQLKRLLRLVPETSSRAATTPPGTYPTSGQRIARVALLATCVQGVLRPEIDRAAIRLLNRRGVEVVILPGAECCGALSHHLGRSRAAARFSKASIDTWHEEIERGGLDAIIATASGCGTMIKDYGHLFRHDEAYADKAKRASSLAQDISEFLSHVGLGPIINRGEAKIAFHSACSLQHGQRIERQPVDLLRSAGFDVRPVPEGHLCCGSAGVYNILQSEIADELLARKVSNITRSRCEIVATGNIGCITQIARLSSLPIVHTVELLDWATGGPMPAEISSASARSA